MKSRITFIFGCLLLFNISFGQEICDNGIDDDQDGLIDLNDDECFCSDLVPSSLIPNPSFEEMECCPMDEAQLTCASDWIQASTPTTDYFHTCDYLTFGVIPVDAPLPFPHGEGAIGFRDGKPGVPNFKEYAGACLKENMEIGTEYTIDFFTGFPLRNQKTSFEITLFATTDCGRLPFGGGNQNFGCPTNGLGWVELDQISLEGNGQWFNTRFEFVADQNYSAIVLGPGCNVNNNFQMQPYFFFDRLVLAESSDFGVPFAAIEGSICNNDLTLIFEDNPDYTFQWYKDGIAIPNATSADYLIPNDEFVAGTYSVIVNAPFGCFSSTDYLVEIPEYFTTFTADFCEGESLIFEGTEYSVPGSYERLLIASDGCDSIVTLELSMLLDSESFIPETICAGDELQLLGETFTEAGVYQLMTNNEAGCDSLIELEIMTVDANEGLDLGSDFTIDLGEFVNLEPVKFDPDNISYRWFDDQDSNLGDKLNLDSLQIFNDQFFYLQVTDENGCTALDSVFIRVNRDIAIYAPNIFSPNDDGNNDNFLAMGNYSIVGLNEVIIYDRWGNLVFTDENKRVGRNQPVFEWDGKLNGTDATEGVYVYVLLADVVDGTTVQLVGDVTLIR